MALGTPVPGTSTVIQVGTTSNPTAPVGGVISFNYGVETPTAVRNYIGQASFSTVGKTARAPQFTCDYETGDSGQLILQAAIVAKSTIYLRYLPDGTNGEILPIKVTGGGQSLPDVNQFISVAFNGGQQGDPVVVGGGFGT